MVHEIGRISITAKNFLIYVLQYVFCTFFAEREIQNNTFKKMKNFKKPIFFRFILVCVLVELLIIYFWKFDKNALTNDAKNFPYDFVELSRHRIDDRWYFNTSGQIDDSIKGMAELKYLSGQNDYVIRDFKGNSLYYANNIGSYYWIRENSHLDLNDDGTNEIFLRKDWPRMKEFEYPVYISSIDSVEIAITNFNADDTFTKTIMKLAKPCDNSDSLWNVEISLLEDNFSNPVMTNKCWYFFVRGKLNYHKYRRLFVVSRENNSIQKEVKISHDGNKGFVHVSQNDTILFFQSYSSGNKVNVEYRSIASHKIKSISDTTIGVYILKPDGVIQNYIALANGIGESSIIKNPDGNLNFIAQIRSSRDYKKPRFYYYKYDIEKNILDVIFTSKSSFTQITPACYDFTEPVTFLSSSQNILTPFYVDGSVGKPFKIGSTEIKSIRRLTYDNRYFYATLLEKNRLILFDRYGIILASETLQKESSNNNLLNIIRPPIDGIYNGVTVEVLPVEFSNSLVLYQLVKKDNLSWWFWRRKWLFIFFLIPTLAIFLIYSLIRYISTKNEMISRLDSAYTRLKTLHNRLYRAREEERQKIAKDIHDDIGQKLTVLKWQVYGLDLNMAGGEEKNKLLDDIAALMNDIRSLAAELRPSLLDKAGLNVTILWFADEINEKTRLSVKSSLNTELEPLNPDLKISVFRFIQEGISNVLKHSDAQNLLISISYKNSIYSVAIKDNGKAVSGANDNSRVKTGIDGLRERFSQFNGKVDFDKSDVTGTKLILKIELGQAEMCQV